MKSGLVDRAGASAWLGALLVAGMSTVGCAITDAGHPASGGESGAGAANGSSGTGASGGAGTDGACEAGSRRCAGDTPQACLADGTWQGEAACKVNEACSGAGVCAAFRLVHDGVGTFFPQPAPPAGAPLVLKEQTLSAVPRTCANDLCITGDLR